MTIRKRNDSVKPGCGIDGSEGENFTKTRRWNPGIQTRAAIICHRRAPARIRTRARVFDQQNGKRRPGAGQIYAGRRRPRYFR